jgi:hypothetical protein
MRATGCSAASASDIRFGGRIANRYMTELPVAARHPAE